MFLLGLSILPLNKTNINKSALYIKNQACRRFTSKSIKRKLKSKLMDSKTLSNLKNRESPKHKQLNNVKIPSGLKVKSKLIKGAAGKNRSLSQSL